MYIFRSELIQVFKRRLKTGLSLLMLTGNRTPTGAMSYSLFDYFENIRGNLMNNLQFEAGNDSHTRIGGKGREEPLPWPSSRYFQIHFEQMHLMLSEMRREMESLRQELVTERRRFDHCSRCARAGTSYSTHNLS